MTQVQIGGKEYPVKLAIGAMIRFQNETGQDCTLFLEEMDTAFAEANGDAGKTSRVVFSRLGKLTALFYAAIENGISASGSDVEKPENALSLADQLSITDVATVYAAVTSTLVPVADTGEAKPKSAKKESR